HYAEETQKACQLCRLPLHSHRAHEVGDLMRRFAAMPWDKLSAPAHVGAIEISDAVIREAGPRPYGLCPRLVAQKPEREIQTKPLAAVAIIRDTHITLPV